MITNSIINLNPTAQERINAINTIKYTLLLDYEAPNVQQCNASLIPIVMEQCQKCCSALFPTPSAPQYNFFGSASPESSKPLAFLANSSKEGQRDSNAYLHTMILQNCVMSSYHAILSALLNGYSIKPYTLRNTIQEHGIQWLYTKKYLNIEETGPTLKPNPGRKTDNKTKSSTASSFRETLRNRKQEIPFLLNFMLSKTETLGIQLQFTSLCQLLVKMHSLKLLNPASINWGNKYQKSLMPSDMLDLLEKHINQINTAVKVCTAVPAADSLYLHYLIERICNFNLFYSLIKNMERIEQASVYRFTGENFLDILASCIKLPNPFSRTYFLHYAFDHIDAKTHSNKDFWHDQDIERADIAVGINRKVPYGFYFDKWFQQFEYFIKIMSQYIIPIYGWCFLTMLLECIENIYPHSPHCFHLENAMNALILYMADNHKSIREPLTLSNKKSMDGVSLISSKNFSVLKNFCLDRKEDIGNLRKSFFFNTDNTGTLKNKDVDLNLTLLNPSVFKGEGGKCRSRILSHYFDLLLWPPR